MQTIVPTTGRYTEKVRSKIYGISFRKRLQFIFFVVDNLVKRQSNVGYAVKSWGCAEEQEMYNQSQFAIVSLVLSFFVIGNFNKVAHCQEAIEADQWVNGNDTTL